MRLFRRKPQRPYVFRGLTGPGKDAVLNPGDAITVCGMPDFTIQVHLDGTIAFRKPMTDDEFSRWAVRTALEEKGR